MDIRKPSYEVLPLLQKQNFDEKDQRIKKLEQDILELSEKFKKTLLEVKINMKKLIKLSMIWM